MCTRECIVWKAAQAACMSADLLSACKANPTGTHEGAVFRTAAATTRMPHQRGHLPWLEEASYILKQREGLLFVVGIHYTVAEGLRHHGRQWQPPHSSEALCGGKDLAAAALLLTWQPVSLQVTWMVIAIFMLSVWGEEGLSYSGARQQKWAQNQPRRGEAAAPSFNAEPFNKHNKHELAGQRGVPTFLDRHSRGPAPKPQIEYTTSSIPPQGANSPGNAIPSNISLVAASTDLIPPSRSHRRGMYWRTTNAVLVPHCSCSMLCCSPASAAGAPCRHWRVAGSSVPDWSAAAAVRTPALRAR